MSCSTECEKERAELRAEAYQLRAFLVHQLRKMNEALECPDCGEVDGEHPTECLATVIELLLNPDPVQPFTRAKVDEYKVEEKAPCGGKWCFRDKNGDLIHAVKSGPTCETWGRP